MPSEHPFPPVFDKDCNILILGTFPSVRSRKTGFFYGHPQNRFWRVTSAVFGDDVPVTKEDKISFLLKHHIALWDVISSCDIEGSSDRSIKNALPNDISYLLENSHITRIFTNGSAAYKLYERYIEPKSNIVAQKLPSTSPANAAWSIEKLISSWQIIKS